MSLVLSHCHENCQLFPFYTSYNGSFIVDFTGRRDWNGREELTIEMHCQTSPKPHPSKVCTSISNCDRSPVVDFESRRNWMFDVMTKKTSLHQTAPVHSEYQNGYRYFSVLCIWGSLVLELLIFEPWNISSEILKNSNFMTHHSSES